jgi:DNA-binding transcriptional LysR family regulator
MARDKSFVHSIAIAAHCSTVTRRFARRKPATSPQIKAMEEECSGLLFDRSEGRITLTAGGQALPPYVEKLKIIPQEALVAVPSALGNNVGQLAEIATLSLG